MVLDKVLHLVLVDTYFVAVCYTHLVDNRPVDIQELTVDTVEDKWDSWVVVDQADDKVVVVRVVDNQAVVDLAVDIRSLVEDL